MAAIGVKNRHKEYDRYASKWQRVRDVVSGQDEVHAKGPLYLPPLIDETVEGYAARVKRTPFYNASWRTMAAFVGMLFRKPAIFEVPSGLEFLLNDVTLSGVDFNSFAQDIALEDIMISRVGILVDYPQASQNEDGTVKTMTVAEAEGAGLRPSMVMYRSESIINWKYEYVNNKYILTQIRLAETTLTTKDEFEVEEENRIRVLDLQFPWGIYRQRVFKEENGEQIGKEVYPLMNGKPLTEIPFYIIGPDGGQSELSEPILIDLVDLNLQHYMVSSDYEHGCHMTGLPTPVISGAQEQFGKDGQVVEQTFYIGSTAAWLLPMGADAKFLEFSGQGLQALENNLTRKEAQMAAIGARMLTAEKSGVEAAETLAMRHSGEHSILSAIAIAVSQGIEKALKTFALWAGMSEAEVAKIKFEINRDFMPFVLSPQALTSLLSTVQAGKLSHEAFFDLLKRGDFVPSDLDFDEEQARIDFNPPMPEPMLGNNLIEDNQNAN